MGPQEPLQPDPVSDETLGPVSGESCVLYFLGIIPLSELNRPSAAMKDALSKKLVATFLVEVTTDYAHYGYIIVTEACTIVEGIALKTK